MEQVTGHLVTFVMGMFGLYWLISSICNKRKDEEDKERDNSDGTLTKDENLEMPMTKELVKSVLRQMECLPIETEEGRIRFDYQGVTFLMEAADECLFVNLIWPWCYSFSKFDIDEFARVRQVVNDVNMRGLVSVFYCFADSDEVAVHMKKNFLFVAHIPHLKDYLCLMLDSLFKTARTLEVEVEKMSNSN